MNSFSTWMKVGAGLGAAIGVREGYSQLRESDLRGEVVLVTGASSGLGLEMARDLAEQGCRLVICARGEEELERAREDLEERGAEVLAVTCDVGNEDEVRQMVDETIGRFGSIDILICNAGVIQVGQYRSMASDDYQRAMDIMFFGTLYPILAVLPHMRERRDGRIALITSIGGKISVPYLLPYNASKFAAVGLGEGLRAELGRDGITVTTIIPGLMRTGSYLNAEFAGEPEPRDAMYRIFSAMSSLPLLTVDAESAAHQFVRAIKRGDAYFIYPPQYNLIARLHGLAPATTMAAMGLAARLMPETGDVKQNVHGETIDDRLETTGAWRLLTTLGRKAVDRMQLRPGANDPDTRTPQP